MLVSLCENFHGPVFWISVLIRSASSSEGLGGRAVDKWSDQNIDLSLRWIRQPGARHGRL